MVLGNEGVSTGGSVASKAGLMEMTPVPMGERRTSGMSAAHSTYRNENYVLVGASVSAIKKGCALGLVLEHLDESGCVTDAEIVFTFVSPGAHEWITTIKDRRLRIKWILTGVRASSTFAVTIVGMPSIPTGALAGPAPDVSTVVDLTSLHGLRQYVASMMQEVEAGG